MKKLIALCLAALMLAAFAACNPTPTPQNMDGLTPQNTNADENGQTEPEKVPIGAIGGLKTDKAFRLYGIQLNGNRAGSADEDSPELVRNGKPIGTENIRVMFELNEWIDFNLGYEYGTEPGKIGVLIVPDGFQGTDLFSGAVYFAEYELPYDTYPEPLNDEFYLNSEEAEPGVYRMIITFNEETIGVLKLYFFAEEELANKTQPELEAMLAVG